MSETENTQTSNKTSNTSNKADFEQAAQEQRASIFSEFLHFLAHNKKWWLLPIVVVLLVLGVLVFLSGTAAAPLIYTLF